MKSAQPHRPAPFLSLRDVAFRLGDRILFQNTTWVFHRGEHWAVLGPNGSGKSLFADALRGRLPLVQGEMRYHFRPPAGLSPEETIGHVSFTDRKLEVHGAVVQSRWNSVEDEGTLRVSEFLSYERVMDINPFEVTRRHDQARPPFERHRNRAIRLLRIRPLLGRSLLALSNGERQRVDLARALCHPLRLLILDEPFAGLDAATREHFHRVLERLMDTPLRVLLITTRPEDLPRHITHLLRVERCQVVAAGPRREKALQDRSRKLKGQRSTSGAPKPHPKILAAASGPELIQLRNVTVRYGTSTILHNINWTVRAGESWALLGPNGSGKTTLLSLILGDNPQAYRNDVTVFGRQRGGGESIWDIKQRIGWVSPELHLHFDEAATCLEVVASGFHETIGLFEPPTSRQRAAARAWLKRFQLLEFARTPLYGLSLGLQRMVLLARALVKQPQLLILDEPCQGLDPAHRALFLATLDALLRAGSVTAIYVTHQQEEIPRTITRTLRLNRGTATQAEAPQGA